MVLSSSAEIWEGIERLDTQKQKDLLEWQLQAREPIRRFADIKLGDHLVTKSSMLFGGFTYEHHFLCVGFGNNEEPKIIHYYNTESILGRFFSTVGGGSGKSLGKMGMIQEMTLPNDSLITEDQLQATEYEEWKMARVVWPDELRRYSVEEIIERARKRIDEDSYDPMRNNCESFVMWCLCGLNISPQATRMRKTLFETGNAILVTGFRGTQQGIKTLFKESVQFLDDLGVYLFGAGKEGAFAQLCENSLSRLGQLGLKGLDVGLLVSIFIEIGVAVKNINNAWEKYNSGVISGEKLFKDAADKVMGAVFRSGGSVAGMIAFGVVGTLFGVFCGHLVSCIISEVLLS